MSYFRRFDSSHFICRKVSRGLREIYKSSFASLGSVLDCYVFFCSAHNISSYFRLHKTLKRKHKQQVVENSFAWILFEPKMDEVGKQLIITLRIIP